MSYLVSELVLETWSTTNDYYIRAEGDFQKEIYVAERTKKADIRLEEQSEKAESCREYVSNEIQLKGPKRQK